MPIQFNFYSGGGLDRESMSVINVQPVLPLAMGTRWNLIARTIVPFVNAPLGNGARTEGLGGDRLQGFVTKAKTDDPTWAVGPVFSFPTANTDAAHTGDWGLGPGVVVVKHIGAFVLRGLVTQMWPVSADGDGIQLNLLTIQPFVNYNLADGWAISTSPIITANWAASDDDEWTIPIGVGVSKVTALGRQPFNVSIQYFGTAERPESAGSSQLRFTVSMLFPKAAAPGASTAAAR